MEKLIRLLSPLKKKGLGLYKQNLQRKRIHTYLNSNRQPWTPGYYEYRNQELKRMIGDDATLHLFAQAQTLPQGYGYRLDARVIEIPWALSRLHPGPSLILDAGSSLNTEEALSSPVLQDKRLIVLTLAPERYCFWMRGVSYLYGDLRDSDIRDDRFDQIICISTIEHIGMDNSRYAGINDKFRMGNNWDFPAAVKELRRVLKPGGSLLITFPFGRYENHGWFQQFDAVLLDRLIDSFSPAQVNEFYYQYHPDGWQLSNREACSHCEFFDVHTSKYFDSNSSIEYPPDYAAGERAVACIELQK